MSPLPGRGTLKPPSVKQRAVQTVIVGQYNQAGGVNKEQTFQTIQAILSDETAMSLVEQQEQYKMNFSKIKASPFDYNMITLFGKLPEEMKAKLVADSIFLKNLESGISVTGSAVGKSFGEQYREVPQAYLAYLPEGFGDSLKVKALWNEVNGPTPYSAKELSDDIIKRLDGISGLPDELRMAVLKKYLGSYVLYKWQNEEIPLFLNQEFDSPPAVGQGYFWGYREISKDRLKVLGLSSAPDNTKKIVLTFPTLNKILAFLGTSAFTNGKEAIEVKDIGRLDKKSHDVPYIIRDISVQGQPVSNYLASDWNKLVKQTVEQLGIDSALSQMGYTLEIFGERSRMAQDGSNLALPSRWYKNGVELAVGLPYGWLLAYPEMRHYERVSESDLYKIVGIGGQVLFIAITSYFAGAVIGKIVGGMASKAGLNSLTTKALTEKFTQDAVSNLNKITAPPPPSSVSLPVVTGINFAPDDMQIQARPEAVVASNIGDDYQEAPADISGPLDFLKNITPEGLGLAFTALLLVVFIVRK